LLLLLLLLPHTFIIHPRVASAASAPRFKSLRLMLKTRLAEANVFIRCPFFTFLLLFTCASMARTLECAVPPRAFEFITSVTRACRYEDMFNVTGIDERVRSS
jgi:hypothetical protein